MTTSFSPSPALTAPVSAPAAITAAAAPPAPPCVQVNQECVARTMNGLQQVQSMFSSPALSSTALCATDVTEEELQEEFDKQTDCLMAAAGVTAADADVGIGESELAKLLHQLHQEPSNDEERAAKFSLYEKFAETVSDARKATLEFWAEAQDEFEGGAKAKVEQDIKRLDGHQNLGFDFAQFEAARRWFVHDMAQQAHKNADQVEGLLGGMRTKLELLTSQADCPICLEPFSGEPEIDATTAASSATTVSSCTRLACSTLSCCHKVCTPCWQNWQTLNPGNAFCPLCREQDFLVRIMPQEE